MLSMYRGAVCVLPADSPFFPQDGFLLRRGIYFCMDPRRLSRGLRQKETHVRRIIILISLAALLGAGSAAAAELELGLSASPKPVETAGEDELQFIPGLHLGYAFGGIFYLSLDSLHAVEAVTETVTDGEILDEKSLINLAGGGLRLHLGPLVSYATVGPSWMSFYESDRRADVGANIKLGLGLRSEWWGITLNGTQFFYNMDAALDTIGDLFSRQKDTRQGAADRITDGMFPTLIFTLYL
jgi:hypothetical protein